MSGPGAYGPNDPDRGPHGGYQYGYGAPPPPPPAGSSSVEQPYPLSASYPPVQTRRGTNGLAIAAFVCSITAFATCLSAPVGLGLGITALRQVKRTGEQGYGLAVAAVVIGGLGTAALAAFAALIAAAFISG